MTDAPDKTDTLFDLDVIQCAMPQEYVPAPRKEARPAKAEEPQTYIAHYTSPTSTKPIKGFFEFQSAQRAFSKQNIQDARIRMLELYGKDAVSWVIDDVRLKKKNEKMCSSQLEIDFRKRKPARTRAPKKKYL